jgi:hypothetical protein
MIITDRFVFLHLHKSGGTFVNELLMQCLPDARQYGYHLPRALIPAEARHLPVLGLVRNPWSYYVSWYAFQKSRSQPNALFHVLSDEGRADFSATVRNMLDLGVQTDRLERLLTLLPNAYLNRGLNLPGFALAPIRNSGLGFYSFLYGYLYGTPDTSLHLGRMEELRAVLPTLLERVGQPVTPAMRQFIAAEQPRNTSRHDRYERCYDADLAALVAERDAQVIAAHGYRFGD